MGTQPNPNMMKAPALMMQFAQLAMQAANKDKDFVNANALINRRQDSSVEAYGNKLRLKTDIQKETGTDPITLANERNNIRRYGTKGSISRTGQDLLQYSMSKGLNAAQSAALVAHMQKESSFNTRAVGDNGTAFYGFQFRHDRKSGIENYAKNKGLDIFDPKTSIDYLIQEMKTSEAGTGGNLFFNARDPDTASTALSKVIRHSTKGKQANETGERIALTKQYLFGATNDNAYKPAKNTQTADLTNSQNKTIADNTGEYMLMPLDNARLNALSNKGVETEILLDQPRDTKGNFQYKVWLKRAPAAVVETNTEDVPEEEVDLIGE
jgi:Phage tail lysozyme